MEIIREIPLIYQIYKKQERKEFIMNKKEFIDRVSTKGYSKIDASTIVDDVLNTIAEVLVEGDSIALHGFGTFSVKERAQHEILDYQTKEKIVVPPHKTPKFAPGNTLKKSIKDGFVRI